MTENNHIKNKTADARFDILKIILSLFVVSIHMQLFPRVLYPWIRIGVPLFFIMSGYFFFLKLNGTTNYSQQKVFLKNFIIRNLLLYTFWFICLLPIILYIRGELFFGHGVISGILAFIKCILFNSSFTASWYIIATIYGTLIIFFLLRKLPNTILIAISTLLYIVASIASSYPQLIAKSEIASTIHLGITNYISPIPNSFIVSVAWIIIGKCFAEKTFKGNKFTYLAITLVSGVLLYLEWLFVKNINGTFLNDCYIMLLPFCIGVFGFVSNCTPIKCKYSINLRKCSIIIFVTHGAVARIIVSLFKILFHNTYIPIAYIVVVSICIGIYLLIEFLINRYKNSWVSKFLLYAF
ncbi:MAG: acyltransferase family protein [Clostridia bacterium]|nr:acyltransferase family protein [Clostridia bacterium]MBR4116698.1 acyltransferase family protein [Clostridia bacterium]